MYVSLVLNKAQILWGGTYMMAEYAWGLSREKCQLFSRTEFFCHRFENTLRPGQDGRKWTDDIYKSINPLRAIFFRGNINIYLHFVSFLHIDTTQVVEILPQIRQEPTYST